MTKKSNLFLRFVLPTFLFLLLSQSCRQELFENKDSSTAQDKSKLHWITKNQIIQNQALYSKIQSLDSSKKQGSSSEKTFIDEENSISVDIEKALVIENEKGKKTYTLIIDRKNPRVLENLVFSETETEELNMYVVSYDSILFKGNEITESGNAKNYITLDFLGKKSVPDVFSKVVSCYDSQQIPVFVPGSLCASGQHAYGIVYDPPCSYHGWQAASPDYWSTQYTFSIYACDDGLPEHVFGTTPIGGGGGWNGNPILTPECKILKANLEKAKSLLGNSNIQNQNNTMIANIVTDSNEKRFYFGKDANQNYQVSSIEYLYGMGGNTTTNLSFIAEGDFHNHNGSNSLSYPSPTDLYGLQGFHSTNPKFTIRFVNGSDGSLYALTITNELELDAFVQGNSLYSTVNVYDSTTNPNGNNSWIKDSKIYDDFYKVAQYFVNQGYSQNDAQTYGMAFVIKKHEMGVNISKKDSNGDFIPIEIKEKRRPYDPENKDYEVTRPCNL